MKPRGKLSTEDSLLLTFEDVASTLRVDRSTVYRYIADGKLPAPIRVGTRPRFLRTDIEAYIAKAASS